MVFSVRGIITCSMAFTIDFVSLSGSEYLTMLTSPINNFNDLVQNDECSLPS